MLNRNFGFAGEYVSTTVHQSCNHLLLMHNSIWQLSAFEIWYACPRFNLLNLHRHQDAKCKAAKLAGFLVVPGVETLKNNVVAIVTKKRCEEITSSRGMCNSNRTTQY